MSRIKVENTVTIYERDGQEVKTVGDAIGLKVLSHWNRRDFIVLQLANGKAISVVASDLQKAIQNAMNAH